jgi:hypothetical protein
VYLVRSSYCGLIMVVFCWLWRVDLVGVCGSCSEVCQFCFAVDLFFDVLKFPYIMFFKKFKL